MRKVLRRLSRSSEVVGWKLGMAPSRRKTSTSAWCDFRELKWREERLTMFSSCRGCRKGVTGLLVLESDYALKAGAANRPYDF